MLKKRIMGIIFVISLAATVFIVIGKVFSDNVSYNAGSPFSTKLAASIGAWYDESWQASGFYRLEREGAGSEHFRYRYTDTPTTDTNPTFVLAPQGGGTPVVIPQDMVVTEWRVSGHVHFSSGM